MRFALGLFAQVAVAVPNERSGHQTPTPQIGGIGIIPVFLVVTLAGMASSFVVVPIDPVVICAVLALTVIGFLDDRRGLPVLIRLVLFVLVVGCVLVWSPALYEGQTGIWRWLVPVCLGFVLLSFVNITNFMDGMDGMIVVEFVPALVMLMLFAGLGEVVSVAPLVPVALLGVLLAFAWFNSPPAKLFLGDAGSLPLGFLMALLLIHFAVEKNPVSAVLPMLYFISDTSLALASRIWRRQKFWRAHREHAYQRAMDSGQSVKSILLRIFLCNTGLCVLSALALDARLQVMLACLLAGGMMVSILLLSLGRKKVAE